MVAVHRYCGLHSLEQGFLVDAREDEARVVKALGAFGGGADADRRERMPHGCEETRLFGECTGVGDHGGGIHLQTVVVVETEGLVLNNTGVKLEARLLQTLAAARVAAVEDWHVIFHGDGVDGVEEREEILLRVDVLLAVGGEEDVSAFLETEPPVDVARLDVGEVLMEHLGHRRAGNVGTLLRQPVISEIATCVLRIAEVHVGDDVHDAAVGLLGQTLVLAAVASLHVEDGDVQTLGCDGRQAGVGVAEDEQRVGSDVYHQLVGAVDDVADCCSEVISDSIHIYLRVFQLQILEEHAVEVVVVVLARMG